MLHSHISSILPANTTGADQQNYINWKRATAPQSAIVESSQSIQVAEAGHAHN